MDHNAHAVHRNDRHAHHGTGDADPAEVRTAQPAVPLHSARQSLNWIAFTATVHCLTGCAIGEVLGMVIGTAAGLDNLSTTVLAVALAFVFGYLLTMLPLLRSGMSRSAAIRLALAADTASITLMEIIDNAIMWLIPGAMDAGLDTWLFWLSLAVALVIAGLAAWPLNRWLIARGRGHAVVHAHHSSDPAPR